MSDGSIEIRARLILSFDGLNESMEPLKAANFVGVIEFGSVQG
jgi:hypothetical protein